MNAMERLNRIVDYIEKHITDDIDMDKLAKAAGCSVYDASRTFALVADITIAEYIRMRRMTLAGEDIRKGDLKIADAALKYRYDSPISFSRAFSAFHGVTPSEARESKAALKSFRRLVFHIKIRQASKRYGKEKMTVNGKEYTAVFLGERNISYMSEYYSKRDILLLENAYEDFKDMPRTGYMLPYTMYPVEVKAGQIFVMDYYKKSDGSVDRKFYRADGAVINGWPSTVEIYTKR